MNLSSQSSRSSLISAFFSGTVLRKLAVALTGSSLVLFLAEHLLGNLLLLFSDSQPYLSYAHFMGTNYIVRILEIGLFAGFALHIVLALGMQFSNRVARPQSYVVKTAVASTIASRSMMYGGIALLLFLILHLSTFFVPHKILHSATQNLYVHAHEAFKQGWYVAIYVLAMVVLSLHLVHGIQSAFQTFGISNANARNIIKKVGLLYAILVPFALAAIPLALHFLY